MDPLEGFTVVRCLFHERRLVLMKEGQILVLREGDSVPGSSLVVSTISPRQATLQERPSGAQAPAAGQAEPGLMVLITERDGGGFEVKVLRDSPPDGAEPSPMLASPGAVPLLKGQAEKGPSPTTSAQTPPAPPEEKGKTP